MLRHLGYVAVPLTLDSTTNRTCRLRNATPKRLRELIRLNLEDLEMILQFNLRHGIFLYRISSQIIPFASHPANRIPWWDEYAHLLLRLGTFARQHGFRVSMHPGQFTVLNSPRREVVAAALRELEWHVRFLDCLGTDPSNKVVVHAGSAHGGKRQAITRLVAVIRSLPDGWRQRLAIENDERIFAVEDVLEVSERTRLPVVFDWLHHRSLPQRGPTPPVREEICPLLERCFDTWHPGEGPPKVHFSSQVPGGRLGQHAEWIDAGDFAAFLRLAPERGFDCMLEAKGKERALLRLRGELRARGIGEPTATWAMGTHLARPGH